jgi:hypothetical protein
MERNIYDKYNRGVGFGQMAPGRDLPEMDDPRVQQRTNINTAIAGGMPVGGVAPFAGAAQTIGQAQQKYPGTTHGSMQKLDALRQAGQAKGQDMNWMQQVAPAARGMGAAIMGGNSLEPSKGPFSFSSIVNRLVPQATPSIAPGEPAPGTQAPAPTAYANDAQGFLTNSLQGIAGKVREIQGQGDDARKKFVEEHIRSLLPELSARGMNVADVRGEKINVGGQWIDLMRDVANGQGGGAAEVQWLVEPNPTDLGTSLVAPMAPPASTPEAQLSQAIEGVGGVANPTSYSEQTRRQILEALKNYQGNQRPMVN